MMETTDVESSTNQRDDNVSGQIDDQGTDQSLVKADPPSTIRREVKPTTLCGHQNKSDGSLNMPISVAGPSNHPQKRKATSNENDDVVKRKCIEARDVTLQGNLPRGRYYSDASREVPKRFKHQRIGHGDTEQRGVRARLGSPVFRPNHTERDRNIRARCMSFRHLEDLLRLDEEQFVLRISENMSRLNEFVDSVNLTDDGYVLIIRLLKKIFDSRFPDTQQIILQTILNERFINNLQKYLGSVPMHDKIQKLRNKFFWQDINSFWTTLIEVSCRALQILPNYASNILPKVVSALQVCIPSFETHQKQSVSDEIKKNLNELDQLLKTTTSPFGEGSLTTATDSKAVREMRSAQNDPPNDFRTISVYPDVSEISRGRSFLRPNIIDGPYRDVNHYLDVQFRLLREDFVSPLRSGVRSIRSGEINRYETVKVHKKIIFLHQENINEYHCIRLRFNFSKKKFNFDYENSKKFMFGSLVCFTPDNFITLKFARIVKRDREDLMKDELVVGFDVPQPDLRYDHDYLMIECSVYFEPYFHVLTALKRIQENEFAMKEYIVNVRTTTALPKYLRPPVPDKIQEEEPVENNLINMNRHVVGLNDSQKKAFEAALTREFAIIQGPPGTGKTFLGLKIAKHLLENYEVWWNSTPMLVICFTNHALDQFMEGLLSTTSDMVRIGGQSKNIALKTLNLSMLRRKTDERCSSKVKHQVHYALNCLDSITAEIKQIEQCVGIASFEGFCEAVPNFDVLFPEENGANFFVEWLLDGYQDRYADLDYRLMNIHLYNDISYDHNNGSQNHFINDEYNAETYDTSAGLFSNMFMKSSTPALTLEGMSDEIENLRRDLTDMKRGKYKWKHPCQHVSATVRNLSILKMKRQYLHRRLTEVRSAMRNNRIRTDINVANLALAIPPKDRWAVYTIWLSIYKRHLEQRAVLLTQKFRGLYKQYEEVQSLQDTHLLRKKKVVGMTTTNAARLRSTLEALRSPIVIVEEAAEVLEAHIVAALTKDCQHLILIGDHKQLKPSSADYSITKDYKLGVSLFERMVNNGIQCHTLNIQHRMRPEISRLICPIIYPDLKDHESVLKRPSIMGIDSPVWFIDHKHMEDDCEDNQTKKNMHEVKLAIPLARHLILNGYNPEKITILAAYLGQMFAMIRERDAYGAIMKNVRISALDNYQGEENDIVILSLVRSNKENKIGFLAMENRVCVALSRAKYGLYIIGNMEVFSSNSKIWKEIKTILERQKAIGPHLMLRCQVHRDITTSITEGEDFKPLSEGGCNQMCRAKLSCSHHCQSLCHIQDRKHEEYRCLERCKRNLCGKYDDHLCSKKCYEQCGPCTYQVMKKLECGHEISLACHDNKCTTIVKTKLPCDHIVEKPCYADVNSYECPMPCEVRVVPCGHSCTRICHIRDDPDHLQYQCMKKCARPRFGCTMVTDPVEHMCPNLCYEPCRGCDIPITKKRKKCPHKHRVACSIDVDSIQCQEPCTKVLNCGHKCERRCDDPCESSCRVKVEKNLEVCGHKVWSNCGQEPDRKNCNQKCPLKLPCGHPCEQKCNRPCTTECKVPVDCQIQAICGHSITRMKCHITSMVGMPDEKLLAECPHPCGAKLKCGHQCSGTCGECLQGRYHKRCSAKCGTILVCNHECRFACREACRPCDKLCSFRCDHSICRKRCGDICTPCKETCRRQCKHRKCYRPCSSICSVSPCTMPCPKRRECGHACIGFCGDPCPPKCLICDRVELLETEMLFGSENESSRFVLLADCHHVIESEGMEQWLRMSDDTSAIGVKVCPKCKTPIWTTLRYSDHIKRAIADINKVKKKGAGSCNEKSNTRLKLFQEIRTLLSKSKCAMFKSLLEKLANRLQSTKNSRRQDVNMIQLTAITAKWQLLQQIAKIVEDIGAMKSYQLHQQQIFNVLSRDDDYITNQEVEDVTNELGRLHRAAQYERLKRSSQFAYYISSNLRTKELTGDIETVLNKFGPYSEDARLKSLLEELKKILGSRQVVTDIEIKQIVTAMNLEQGHWFKCPNGHVYAIGECGRATQVSKCNECGAHIGGTSHRLLPNNSLAPEMDGATYAAYSNTANNMRNVPVFR